MESGIDLQDEIKLRLTPIAENYLYAGTRWVKFLSILGFVLSGLMVIGSLSIGTMASFLPMAGATNGASLILIVIVMLVVSVLYFVIAYNMYDFATKTQRSVRMREELSLEEGLKAFKRYNMIFGILAIVALSFYLLAIFVVIIAGAASAF